MLSSLFVQEGMTISLTLLQLLMVPKYPVTVNQVSDIFFSLPSNGLYIPSILCHFMLQAKRKMAPKKLKKKKGVAGRKDISWQAQKMNHALI